MTKHKDQFKCTACDGVTTKWQGQCPHCGEWNTLEAYEPVEPLKKRVTPGTPPPFYSLSNPHEPLRFASGIEEFDRVVGGGLMEGSIVLLGGDPGVGKSTLALQLCKE